MFRINKTIRANNSKLTKMSLKFEKLLNINILGIITKTKLCQRLYTTCKKGNVYLIDEDDNKGSNNTRDTNKYSSRTHSCGELRSSHIGERVSLCGWIEYQRMNKFLLLRDCYGETQILVDENNTHSQNIIQKLPFESVVEVKGTVRARPVNMINKNQKTGEVEVIAEDVQVLNKAKSKLPFNIREFQKAKEPLRMQYRYLDLRFPQMQRNLRVRSDLLMKMREYLINKCDFVDVETPTLFKATPGGAQEFVVPTRFPGLFYSLVQSPQQFKQMLMGGGIDRYFQIARCYRDESARSDRQPEFTQLDIELSFTSIEDVIGLVEDLLNYSWPEFLNPLPKKIARRKYKEIIEEYGTDKPDTSFEFKIQNCTQLLQSNNKISALEEPFGAYCIIFPNPYATLDKKIKETITNVAKRFPKAKLVQSKINEQKEWCKKVDKLLTETFAMKFVEVMNVPKDCVLFLSYGKKNEVLSLLGEIRLEYVNYLENFGVSIRNKDMNALWIVDFPLFELDEELNCLKTVHHPFTAPKPEDIHLLEKTPLDVRSLSYDLVLNGNEIAGGSIRVHDPVLQEKLFQMLNIDKSSLQHVLDMLASGCPPHGGIALGLDRLLQVILKTTSIRDVIAFPKNFEGRDPLSGAPSHISEEVQKLYNIKTDDPAK